VDIEKWWKGRMGKFFVARMEERGEDGKLFKRFKELTAERVELLKLVEKRGELLTRYLAKLQEYRDALA
jgi:hypothetical protein